MVCWPSDYDGAWTLAGSARRSGIGLHSGHEVAVLLHPWPDAGVWVSWSGDSEPPVRLQPSQVRDSQLCTTLELGDRRLSTVEHLLAALAGLIINPLIVLFDHSVIVHCASSTITLHPNI